MKRKTQVNTKDVWVATWVISLTLYQTKFF